MTTIETLMATDLIEAAPQETVADVAARMAKNKVGAVLINDGEQMVGLFSERDLAGRVVAAGLDPSTTPVGKVATRDIVSIEASKPLRDVLALFREKHFRHLPVTRGGKFVGILSTRDFLAHLVGGLEHFIEKQKYASEVAEGADPYDHIGGSYGR
jgi:CBS domain-containing protein